MHKRRLFKLCFLLLASLAAGCGSRYSAPVNDIEGGPRFVTTGRTHRVNQGETLYAIAWIYDLNYIDLARINNLAPPYTIYSGQSLSVDMNSTPAPAPNTPVRATAVSPPANSGPSSTPAPAIVSRPAPPPATVFSTAPLNWAWPASGPLVGRFSNSGLENKGIDIGGSPGDAVTATAAGEVVYAGRGLLRYGDLIIIKHNAQYLSAYAHNSSLLVSEGEQVARGQKIAELGSTGIDRTMLHFEIREDGKPIDPLPLLPGR